MGRQIDFRKIAIIGTAGIPGNYGGFETLSENLVRYHYVQKLKDEIIVYCSSHNYLEKKEIYLSSRLKYFALNANGVQSIPYDIVSLLSAVWNRNDVILILGVSGAIVLPIIRLISSARLITNIDGIEWRRKKWHGLTKLFLRISEKLAVKFSHEVIADNEAISDYVAKRYDVESHVIAYGGDHALTANDVTIDNYVIPEKYAFSVCRIEPENNVHLILEAFSHKEDYPLVIVGNWENSDYGRTLREQFSNTKNIILIDPIYDLGKLKTLRSKTTVYIHGHSAGGTNPSLVEAMHFGVPIIAFDCDFNRYTTEDKALYFIDIHTLNESLDKLDNELSENIGEAMLEIAQRRYTWEVVGKQYFDLINA